MDYTKFLKIKNQLQKFYNFIAKEEREIIYSCKLDIPHENTEEELRRSSVITRKVTTEFICSEDLVALTHKKGEFYIEYLKITNKEMTFKNCSNLRSLSRLLLKSENQIQLRVSEQNYEINIIDKLNINELIWTTICILKILKINNQIQIKGINFKDLDDLAEKNKFYLFNPLLEAVKTKSKYDIEVSEYELDILKQTLESVNIDSIKQYDLESLNTKIEQFNINMKENFLKILQGDFKKKVSYFMEEIQKMDGLIEKYDSSLKKDQSMIEEIWQGIQKIEDANHRVELRNENKKKLYDFMEKLLEQLTVDKSQEYNLIHCTYTSTSELLVVDQFLSKFLKFFKSRKKQDIKMNIIKEGNEKIRKTVEQMLQNFYFHMNNYIRTNKFKETCLIKNMAVLKNQLLAQCYNNLTNKNKSQRTSLNNFLKDRKFVIEKINILVGYDETLDKADVFKKGLISITKGIRDLIYTEVASNSNLWESFFKSELLNYNLNLDQDEILELDIDKMIKNDLIFEANKFFSCLLLNSFFTVDNCAEMLLNYFSEEPVFLLDKASNLYTEVEQLITSKIFQWLTHNCENLCKISCVFTFILHSILSTIQEKIQKNVMEDMVILSIKDIYEYSYKIEDNYKGINDDLSSSGNHNFNMDDHGMSRISLQETKNFIVRQMQQMSKNINEFIRFQKDTILNYKCDIRRVGIIPIVMKTCHLMKIIVFSCCGIKQDYTFDICEDFVSKLRGYIEKQAKIDKKYTNIVLLENYHYLNRSIKIFEENNIISIVLSKIEKETSDMYLLHTDLYIKEIFKYQFEAFSIYYHDLIQQTSNTSFELIKLQSNFTFNNFEKKITSFLKDFSEGHKKMAKRMEKHLCVEEDLVPVTWNFLTTYINSILHELETISKKCYDKPLNEALLKNVKQTLNTFDLKSFLKK